MNIDDYKRKFTSLNVQGPHKICMLLALLDLARAGCLKQNRILYDANLLQRYEQYFDAVKSEKNHPNPYYPFFHLSGDLKNKETSFWHLQPVSGKEQVVEALDTVRSNKNIMENIAYAYIDEELFSLLQQESSIDILGNTLAAHWFDRGLQDLYQIAEQGKRISQYEHQLRDLDVYKVAEPMPDAVRSPAFRRVVTENYDYRCAATGLRIILPDGSAMVEAAHIHPFCESRDDDPRNGLALTPDMHWAMDKNLIAPGPDYIWHVSKQLDDRIPDYKVLTELKGKQLFLPKEQRLYPKREVLEWRVGKL